MNTITTEVQQVTTRSQAKASEWEVQDDIRKATKFWVDKANEANIDRMHQDTAIEATSSHTEDATMGEDPVWQALTDYQITFTMNKLLNLVPRF